MEEIFRYQHLEQARNAAIAWLEARGAHFGLNHNIEIGRLGTFEGAEVGVLGLTPTSAPLKLVARTSALITTSRLVGSGPSKGQRSGSARGRSRSGACASTTIPPRGRTIM